MTHIESKIGTIKLPDEKIYNFLSDFNNFKSLIPPDKLKNWSSSADSCHFTVDGLGNADLKIIEKKPFNLIKIASEGNSPVSFFLWIQIKKVEVNDSRIRIVIEPLVNQMLMVVVKDPLQKFVDMLVDQLEKLPFE